MNSPVRKHLPALCIGIALLSCAIVLLLPADAWAQSVNIDLGSNENEGGAAGATARLLQLTLAIGVLSLAPSILVMVTAFTRIIIVLSILRGAIGAQGTPPNPVLIGIALFLTYFVMEPVLVQSWTEGLQPMTQGSISEIEGLTRAAAPFHKFMLNQVRPSDLNLFLDLANVTPPTDPDTTPWRVLVPSFVLGELRRGFEIGFLIYLPFLIIDMVIASILMGMGMMMLPPNAVSLPFKLIFFVLIDGWRLIAGSLVQGFHVT